MGLCVVGQVRLLLCRDPKLLPWLGLELTEAREEGSEGQVLSVQQQMLRV